jgi:hypothetical protein
MRLLPRAAGLLLTLVFVPLASAQIPPSAGELQSFRGLRTLIAAQAPLDHVNNLGWTAVIESIVLGDGGRRHIATLKALIDAGADINLADRSGDTPLALARRRGYAQIAAMLMAAGAH